MHIDCEQDFLESFERPIDGRRAGSPIRGTEMTYACSSFVRSGRCSPLMDVDGPADLSLLPCRLPRIIWISKASVSKLVA